MLRGRASRLGPVAVAVSVVALAVGVVVRWSVAEANEGKPRASDAPAAARRSPPRRAFRARWIQDLAERRAGPLAAPVQDAAAAPAPGGVLFLGGLDRADVSTGDVRLV